jgi:hypothetical protein
MSAFCAKDIGRIAERAEAQRNGWLQKRGSPRGGDVRQDYLDGGFVLRGESKVWQVDSCDSCRQEMWLGCVHTSTDHCRQEAWRGCVYNKPNWEIMLCFLCDTERTLAEGPSPSLSRGLPPGLEGSLALNPQAFPFNTESENLQDHFVRYGFVVVGGLLDGVNDDLSHIDLVDKIVPVARLLFTTDMIFVRSIKVRNLTAVDHAAVVDRCLTGLAKKVPSVVKPPQFNQEGVLQVLVAPKALPRPQHFSVVPGSHVDFFRVFSNTPLLGDVAPTRMDQCNNGKDRRNYHMLHDMIPLSMKDGDVVLFNDKLVHSKTRYWSGTTDIDWDSSRHECPVNHLPGLPADIPIAWVGSLDDSLRKILVRAACELVLKPVINEWPKGHVYKKAFFSA